MAHDFNNALTAILGACHLLRRSPRLGDDDREVVGLIEESAARGAGVARQMLVFAGGGPAEVAPFDLRDALNDAVRRAIAQFVRGITLHVAEPPVPVTVEGGPRAGGGRALRRDRERPRGGRGRRRTIEITLDRDATEAHIAISDTGPGMDAAVRERAFDPFFTTKPAGAGLGLGLAAAFGVVGSHHGAIDLHSEAGRGATVTLRFPLAGIEP